MSMRTIDLALGSPSLQQLLQMASESNILLKTSDGKQFILAEVDDFDRDLSLIREDPELLAFLEERSRPARTYSVGEVKGILGLDP